jgi:hypothetical protein
MAEGARVRETAGWRPLPLGTPLALGKSDAAIPVFPPALRPKADRANSLPGLEHVWRGEGTKAQIPFRDWGVEQVRAQQLRPKRTTRRVDLSE